MIGDAGGVGTAGALSGHDPSVSTAENYRRFAVAVGDRSAAYAALAEAVATDRSVLRFLDRLPAPKRQPNLLFAAARYLLGVPADIAELQGLVDRRAGELAAVMRARRTQTNEPARCATLLPALAALGGPLALLEVGASAGLTLLPDYYSYDYDYDPYDDTGRRVVGVDPDGPVLACHTRGPVPLPQHVPTITWRAGIDLNPLNAADPDDARWLESLLWPGEEDRPERLRAALATCRRHPPIVHRGDLVDDLARVASGAPHDATLVVYHSAVLSYVDEPKRQAFATAVADLGAVWLSNEPPGIVGAASRAARGAADGFVLVRDGQEQLACTDSHGTWIEWTA